LQLLKNGNFQEQNHVIAAFFAVQRADQVWILWDRAYGLLRNWIELNQSRLQ